jgi:DNA-binding MarR family transcriptional regulator
MSSEELTIEVAADTDREQRIERIAADLLPSASQLTRLVVRRATVAGGGLARTEGGILRTLSEGERRITEIAELEGLAQPTTTALIKRLEEQGLVARGRDATDGRVALISLTTEGADALEEFRRRYRGALAERLHAMSDEELAELDAASRTLGRLVRELQGGGER